MKSGEILKYVLYALVALSAIGLLAFVLWPKKPLPKPLPINPPVGPLPPPQPVYPIVPPLPIPPVKKEKEYFVVGLAKKPTITTYDPKELNDIVKTFGAETPKRPVQATSPGGTKYWTLPDAKGEQWGSNPAWGVTSKGQPTTFLLKQGPYTAEIASPANAAAKPVGYIVYGIKPTQAELKAAKYQPYTVLPYYAPMTPQEQKVQTSVWSRNDICIQPYPVANRTSTSRRNYKCLNNQTLSLAVAKCQSDADACKGFSLNEKTGQACYYGLVAQNPQPMADTQFYSKCQFQMAS